MIPLEQLRDVGVCR